MFHAWYNALFPVRNGIYHTTPAAGEDIYEAITRAAYEACQRNCRGYSVDCSKCGESLADCEGHARVDAVGWQRQHGLGLNPFYPVRTGRRSHCPPNPTRLRPAGRKLMPGERRNGHCLSCCCSDCRKLVEADAERYLKRALSDGQ